LDRTQSQTFNVHTDALFTPSTQTVNLTKYKKGSIYTAELDFEFIKSILHLYSLCKCKFKTNL